MMTGLPREKEFPLQPPKKPGGPKRGAKPGAVRSDSRRAMRPQADSARKDSAREERGRGDAPRHDGPQRKAAKVGGQKRDGMRSETTAGKPAFAKGPRKSLGDRPSGDRPSDVRNDRPERASRPDRSERGQRSDRVERQDRTARPLHSDGARPSASRSAPRGARPSVGARPASGDRTARPVRAGKPPIARTSVAVVPAEPVIIPATGTHDAQRIAKLLARAGIASRREIERMIAEGRIALDGVALTTPATIVTSLRGITVDGVAVSDPEGPRLFRYHKPAGLITAASDPAGRQTIYDRLPAGLPRLMPVGRLDYNTEGLLLMTNDGELKRQMELPSSGVERTYRARAYGEVSQAQLEDLFMGLEIDGMRYGRIEANLERRTGRNQWIEMTLTEGKNREVRRVLEHLGLEVSRLIRTRYGPFLLEDMPVGSVDEIRPHDLEFFVAQLKKEGKK